VLREEEDPNQALTASVQDALRLACCAVGFTIHPGSAHQLEMYGQLRAHAEEAKRNGLAVVIWSYPRGSGLSRDGESGIDVVGYAVQIAARHGAHIIKVKLPMAHIGDFCHWRRYATPSRSRVVERRRATQMFCYSVRKQVAAMIAALDGVDLVVFTGGIGENDEEVRAAICRG
jgi:class I fructose-bisphosphate aldolase